MEEEEEDRFLFFVVSGVVVGAGADIVCEFLCVVLVEASERGVKFDR